MLAEGQTIPTEALCTLPYFLCTNNQMVPFTGAFTKLQKVTISFVMSVRLSIHPSAWNKLVPTGWIFCEIWYLFIFWKSVEKIQVSLKSEKNNGYFTWWPIHFWSYLTHFFLEWDMFETNVEQKIETHILSSITFFKNCTFHEIMWKNTVQLGRPQMTIWLMHIAYWISKSTNTSSEYVILINFPLQKSP